MLTGPAMLPVYHSDISQDEEESSGNLEKPLLPSEPNYLESPETGASPGFSRFPSLQYIGHNRF